MKRYIQSIAVALFAAAFVSCSHSTDTSASSVKPYKLNKCLVTDEKFDHDTYTFVHQGQEVKLCCKSCLKDFNADPKKYLSKLK